MLDKEAIIQSGNASSLQLNNKAVKGQLYLTTDSLMFVPNLECKDANSYTIPLTAICKLSTSKICIFFAKKLIIYTPNHIVRFKIDYPNTWMQLIKEQRVLCI